MGFDITIKIKKEEEGEIKEKTKVLLRSASSSGSCVEKPNPLSLNCCSFGCYGSFKEETSNNEKKNDKRNVLRTPSHILAI